MPADKKIAVLIDAENVSHKYIKYIMDELTNHGTPTYKRVYGDWTKPQMSPWKPVLLKHSIAPIQQYSYTTGKNSTDAALIIDAMDILYSGSVDGFCIVSSDSDFTKIAARLREAGMYVLGMGEKKTPMPFITACEKFKYLEVLAAATADAEKPVPPPAQPVSPPPAQPAAEAPEGPESGKEGMATLSEITEAIHAIVDENSDEDGWTYLGEVGNNLNKRYPDFDSRNYGFSKLTPFVSSLKVFEIMSRKTSNPHISHKFIRNKKTPA